MDALERKRRAIRSNYRNGLISERERDQQLRDVDALEEESETDGPTYRRERDPSPVDELPELTDELEGDPEPEPEDEPGPEPQDETGETPGGTDDPTDPPPDRHGEEGEGTPGTPDSEPESSRPDPEGGRETPEG